MLAAGDGEAFPPLGATMSSQPRGLPGNVTRVNRSLRLAGAAGLWASACAAFALAQLASLLVAFFVLVGHAQANRSAGVDALGALIAAGASWALGAAAITAALLSIPGAALVHGALALAAPNLSRRARLVSGLALSAATAALIAACGVAVVV